MPTQSGPTSRLAGHAMRASEAELARCKAGQPEKDDCCYNLLPQAARWLSADDAEYVCPWSGAVPEHGHAWQARWRATAVGNTEAFDQSGKGTPRFLASLGTPGSCIRLGAASLTRPVRNRQVSMEPQRFAGFAGPIGRRRLLGAPSHDPVLYTLPCTPTNALARAAMMHVCPPASRYRRS